MRLASNGYYYDAFATSTSGLYCSALATTSGTGSQTVFKKGYFKNASWNFTPGLNVFLSTVSGTLTQSTVSGTGQQVQIVGYAEKSNVIWFEPNFAVGEVK